MKRARGKTWSLVCGESIEVLRGLGDELVDGLVTDPPYSSGGMMRGDRSNEAIAKYTRIRTVDYAPNFDGDTRDQRGFLAWSSLWLTQAYRVTKRGAAACVFSDWRQCPATSDAFQAGGFVWRGLAVWSKGNKGRPQLGRFRADAEFVVWGSRGPMKHLGQGALAGTWRHLPVPLVRRRHITEKPVPLMEEIVLIVPRGGLVLDPFAGSGSTGVACVRTGRRFLGVERDRAIFTEACDRLADAERNAPSSGARRP